ncbi:F-box protein At1g47056-like [Telopea speciosissima]|uniref:F-box protein At1g47056-like n=1 Tax=Telopea speciosissima TaxID=54955 RepID=UPI001CC5A583|nr:F-box protein At1g47056-like [Telopea speciosissima]
MAAVAVNCKGLKKLYCDSCEFGAKGMNAVLDHSSSLQELYVVNLGGLTEDSSVIGPGVAAYSLKKICIKGIHNGQCFGPLIIGSKNLKTLEISLCYGDWDQILEAMAEERVTGLVEVHLKTIRFTDVALAALSNCSNLKILHLINIYYCKNVKLIGQLYINGGKIGDEGLTAIAKRCPNLEELVLSGVNPTCLSLGVVATNCQNLERLALCRSNTIGDAEISCIAAAQCIGLKHLVIMDCPGVTHHGMEALLTTGCPNLVKVNVWNCKRVTDEVWPFWSDFTANSKSYFD